LARAHFVQPGAVSNSISTILASSCLDDWAFQIQDGHL
jgi:hypothetical protein